MTEGEKLRVFDVNTDRIEVEHVGHFTVRVSINSEEAWMVPAQAQALGEALIALGKAAEVSTRR